jgi:hypothetical protein
LAEETLNDLNEMLEKKKFGKKYFSQAKLQAKFFINAPAHI